MLVTSEKQRIKSNEDAVASARNQVVERAVKAIQNFHKIGRSLQPKTSHKEAYGTSTIAAAAKKHGINPDTMRKSRQFAAAYSTTEVDTLCDLIRRKQAGQDMDLPVFGRTHVIRMLTVPKPKRRALERLAITEAWSLATLESEIAERFGTRRDGGRPRRAPRSTPDLMVQLDGMCESWSRWQQAIEPKKERAGPAQAKANEVRALVTLAALPNSIQAQLSTVMAAIGILHAAVVKELQHRAPDRSVRHQFRNKSPNVSGVRKRSTTPR